MPLHTKTIYADIYSLVKKKKITFKNTNNWPIEGDNFEKFYLNVISNFRGLISKQKNPVDKLLEADVKYLMNLLEYLHYLIALQLVKKNKNKEKNFDKILKKYKKNLFKSVQDHNRSQYNIFTKSKEILKNILYSSSFENKVLVIGSRTQNLIDFMNLKKESPIFAYADLIFSKNKKQFNINKVDIIGIDLFLTNIQEYVKKNFRVKINLQDLKKLLVNRIEQSNRKYLNILNSNYIKKFSKIYFTDDARLEHRLLSTAAQKLNIKTYKFDHGNNFYLKESALTPFFLSNYSYHVCDNKISYNFLTKLKKKNKNFPKTIIINAKINTLKKKIKKNISTKINVIMLVGYPMTTHRYISSEDLFWHQQFFMELKILQTLKESGCKVLYQIHPGVKGWEHAFSEYVDEFIYEKFEKTWVKTDLLIFGHTATTTFGYALSTNIPIVLVDYKKEKKWSPGAFEYIKNRCSLVTFKNSNLISILDKNKFLKAVGKIGKVNKKFILNSNINF